MNILKSNSEKAGGMKADLVLKVYALLMQDVVLRSAENTQQTVLKTVAISNTKK